MSSAATSPRQNVTERKTTACWSKGAALIPRGQTITEFAGDVRAWINPAQELEFIDLLRDLFGIFCALPPEVNKPTAAEKTTLRDSLLQTANEFRAERDRLIMQAALAEAYGLSEHARIERDDAAKKMIAAEQLTLRAAGIDIAKCRNRTDPRLKYLQEAIVAAFNKHFGTPQHDLAAKLAGALLEKETSREVTRSARRRIAGS